MNKVLVEVYVPLIDLSYEVFIPINKKVNNIIYLLSKGISELNEGLYPLSSGKELYSKQSGIKYKNDIYIKETDIRNGTLLILM